MSYTSNWTDAHRAHYFRICSTYGYSDVAASALNRLYAITGRDPVNPMRAPSFNNEGPMARGFMTKVQAC